MPSSTVRRLGAILAFLGVALGAFGAHSLKGMLEAHSTSDIWQKAVFYHLIHAVALVALANGAQTRRCPVLCLALGVALFSGSLYALALTGVRALGAVTPFGGVLLLVGWALVAAGKRAEP